LVIENSTKLSQKLHGHVVQEFELGNYLATIGADLIRVTWSF
jgi:hypothetical protein